MKRILGKIGTKYKYFYYFRYPLNALKRDVGSDILGGGEEEVLTNVFRLRKREKPGDEMGAVFRLRKRNSAPRPRQSRSNDMGMGTSFRL